MSLASPPSRASFAAALAGEAAAGKKALLLSPLGFGKTHALLFARDSLRDAGVPSVFVDLFTAASTPERLLATLAQAVSPFMENDGESIQALSAQGEADRQSSPLALLRLLEVLATRPPSRPFVWLIDEVTEIRSLAYFPGLGQVEQPFTAALEASRGVIATSSYLGLASDLFPGFEAVALPGLTGTDLESAASRPTDREAVAAALGLTGGSAATVLPLVADLRDSRDPGRSLVRLLRPGGELELICRRHYEVLLMRSRGYAVSKRAAEVVAEGPDLRLTDLFPRIGRTAGASRQYLRWLVEVGLLTQTRKRYNFADPMLALWAGLYLGRGSLPGDDEIQAAIDRRLGQAPAGQETNGATRANQPPVKRPDRFEEFD